MPSVDFNCRVFDQAGVPIRPNGTRNSYGCFNGLKGCYGVYLFHSRDDRIVRYVGRAGTVSNPDRDLYARLQQHYTKSTGANFYRNWLAVEHPGARRDEPHLWEWHDDFLRRFEEWSLTTLTTVDHGAVELVRAIEHALIHALHPTYNGHDGEPCRMPAQLSASATWCAGRTVLEVRLR